MNTCAVRQVNTLQPADHICIWDKTRWPFRYSHHGIVYSRDSDPDDIQIAHYWSPIDGFRESQADSQFRLTSLAAFLNDRPLSDMRRVQYGSSLIGDALSKLGETHRSKSDIPPIVLARCRFLLGQGKGHFNILSMNCEHVALWCTTGVVWSKQLYYKVHASVPYALAKGSDALRQLEGSIAKLRQDCLEKCEQLQRLDGKRVYLRLGETKYVRRLGDQLYAVHNDPAESDLAFRSTPTSFVVQVQVVRYNCVHLVFCEQESGQFLCCKAKSLALVRRRSYHRERSFIFEHSWNGELQSHRHRRWLIGAQTRDGLLRAFNIRDKAAQFEIVNADEIDAQSVPIALNSGASQDTVVAVFPEL